MTAAEWKRRCGERIYRAVKKAGWLRIRDLKRATHYNRGPEDCIGIWYDALESLEAGGWIQLEKDDYDSPHAAGVVKTGKRAPCFL